MPYSFAQWLHHFTFPPTVHEVLSFPTSLPRLIAFCLVIVAVLMGEVVSHCGLICISPAISDIEHLHMCFLAIWITFFNFFFYKDFIYLFDSEREREGERTSRGSSRGRERGRSKLPAEQGAQHGARSQDPRIMMSRRQTLNRLSHPGAPICITSLDKCLFSLLLIVELFCCC